MRGVEVSMKDDAAANANADASAKTTTAEPVFPAVAPLHLSCCSEGSKGF